MPPSIRQLVLGFDFSTHARAALVAALDLAGRNDATLHVVTAAAGAVDERVMEAVAEAQTPKLRADFLARLESYVRLELTAAARPIAVTYHVGMGPVAEMLLSVAHEVRADLILLGAVGNRPPAPESLAGADVLRVIRGSVAPVLILRSQQPYPPHRVLCALDFAPASTAALELADQLASLGPGELEAVHALVPVTGTDRDGFALPIAETILRARTHMAERRMAATMSHLRPNEEPRPGHVVTAGPADVLLARLLDEGFDLLALGTVGAGGGGTHALGATAERLVTRAPCNVLVVPPPPPPATQKLRWDADAQPAASTAPPASPPLD